MTSLERRTVGDWGPIKNEIINQYSDAYMRIMQSQAWCAGTIYVDVFAGSPENTLRSTGELVPGSEKLALSVVPPFDEYHFVDVDKTKVEELRIMAQD